MSKKDKNQVKQELEKLFQQIQDVIGIYDKVPLDHVKDTPKRIAKMLVDELFNSLFEKPPAITTFNNKNKNKQIVLIRDIEVRSTCSHHWMPFYGKATIAYVPDKKVAGLSKFARIVDYFSRKPQIQEELTNEVADYLYKTLKPKAIGIYMSCIHMCMRHRGVQSDNSITDTFAFKGKDKNEVERIKKLFDSIIVDKYNKL